MSQEIFKINYNRYQTIFYKNSSPIDLKSREDINYVEEYYPSGLFVQSHSDEQELTFSDNFANIMASVGKSYVMIVIEKTDKKLSLKIFHGGKYRKRGNKWFKVSKNVEYLTLSLDKGDVYSGHLHDFQKKKKFKSRVRRNCFITDPINEIKNKIRNLIPLDKEQKVSISENIIKIFLKEADGQESSRIDNTKRLCDFYLKGKGIKYPDNYMSYFGHGAYTAYNGGGKGLLPKMKTLRKFNMKLVDAFMYENDLKGDVIKKVIHETKRIHLDLLKIAMNLFPNSMVLQEYELVKKLIETEKSGSFDFDTKRMSKKEIQNFFSCFKNSILDSDIDYWSLRDHTEMYSFLKNVGENIKWTSYNHSTFREEHLDWTDKCDFYRRGYYTRIYPISLDLAFKIPIIDGDDVYYPIILKESDEYNEESRLQQNCVKTYIGRPSSLIISLRKNSTISDERATIEYQIFKKDDVITFNRPQSLGKYNSRLDSSWNEALKSLDQMMENWIGDGKNFETVKLQKILENKNKLYSDSEWSENGFLFWTYNVINKNSPHYNFFN